MTTGKELVAVEPVLEMPDLKFNDVMSVSERVAAFGWPIDQKRRMIDELEGKAPMGEKIGSIERLLTAAYLFTSIGSYNELAKVFGVSRQAIRYFVEKHDGLKALLSDVVEAAKDDLEELVWRRKNDPRVMELLVKTRLSDRGYSTTNKIVGADGGAVAISAPSTNVAIFAGIDIALLAPDEAFEFSELVSIYEKAGGIGKFSEAQLVRFHRLLRKSKGEQIAEASAIIDAEATEVLMIEPPVAEDQR